MQKKNGEAYSVRYSNTRKVESVYFASKVNNDYIIRSAIDMKDIKLLEKNYSKYYISIILFSFILSFFIFIQNINGYDKTYKKILNL